VELDISGTSEEDIRICHIILSPTLEEGEGQRRMKESGLIVAYGMVSALCEGG
jgi:hypothetical protein